MLYRLFDLIFSSNLALPGLPVAAAKAAPEVELCLGSLPSWLSDISRSAGAPDYVSSDVDRAGEPVVRTWRLNGGSHLRLRFSDGVEFVFDCYGRQLWSVWPDSMSVADMASYLLGPVMGLLLRLRGLVCLHASAIALGDRAIAFVGAAGAGKSTIATAFAKLGIAVLSDDVVALKHRGEKFLVPPGEPRLRLWPDSVETLFGAPDFLPRMTPTWDKRYLDLQKVGFRYHGEAVPLAALYVLSDRSNLLAPAIETLSVRQQVMALIAYSYANKLLDSSMRAHEFEFLGRLVEQVSIKRVRPSADPARLAELCELIINDFHAGAVRREFGVNRLDTIHV